ncbi:hypothetical protein [Flavobacterium caeni]|uniref:Uncharacterized protein n=1 Tax=Flavobacterium caeni TaxID=490189 RepID=A0A1G5D4L9_9FLAO|nr:hypothetical protein [Flavobacterium caeni]SCY09461.1 hypothetical protein SAMN02927903_00741 [Flavobacterium caeni]
MLLKTNLQDDLFFAFLIPHVSKLLIYRDHWNEGETMRKVLPEVLREGLFAKLSVGNQAIDYCGTTMPYEDCAIINIGLFGLENLTHTPSSIETLFAAEIDNRSNVIQFSNTIIDRDKNVSCIECSVQIAHASAPVVDDYRAA